MGARTWLHLGPARPPGWGRGAGTRGRKSRPGVALARSLPGCGRPQPQFRTCSHSCTPDSLPIARPELGKGRGAPAGLPLSVLRQGTSSALHHPPGHKELLLVLKACLKSGRKRLLPQLWMDDGRGLSCFYFPPPPGLLSARPSHSTFRRKVEAKPPNESRKPAL